MDKGIQEKAVRKDASEKGVRSYNRYKRKIWAQEGEDVSIV